MKFHPIALDMEITVNITAKSINVVCSTSVQIIVRTPPLNVYRNISNIKTAATIQKGTEPAGKNVCNTRTTIKILTAAPNTRETIKTAEPVLYVVNPNLSSK